MSDPKHCDDYIDDESAPEALRTFLRRARSPAHGHLSTDPYPVLFADHDGKRVRVVMASRLGDVGITEARFFGNDATAERDRLQSKSDKLTQERDAALEQAATERQRYDDERAANVALGEERDRFAAEIDAAHRLIEAERRALKSEQLRSDECERLLVAAHRAVEARDATIAAGARSIRAYDASLEELRRQHGRDRDQLRAELDAARQEVAGLTADLERAADLLEVTGSPKAAGEFREALAYRAARDKAGDAT